MKISALKAVVVGLGSIGVRHLNNLYTLGVRELGAVRTRNLPPPAQIIPKNVQLFQSLSMSAPAIPRVKQAIRRLSLAECQQIYEDIAAKVTVRETRGAVKRQTRRLARESQPRVRP